jgi:hypothetical protein
VPRLGFEASIGGSTKEAGGMSREKASDLARQCTELVRKGNNFPTVWSTLLKNHKLMEGIPRERTERSRNLLHIPLIAGEQLVFDAEVREFRVQ